LKELIMPEPKSRRIPHPIWFGVVALLMLVVAVFLSVWIPYHREQIAIREIERLGGEARSQSIGSEWLQKSIGNEWLRYFESV
jgi:hypothetical protein